MEIASRKPHCKIAEEKIKPATSIKTRHKMQTTRRKLQTARVKEIAAWPKSSNWQEHTPLMQAISTWWKNFLLILLYCVFNNAFLEKTDVDQSKPAAPAMAVAATTTTTTKRIIQNAWNWNCERCASRLISVDETHSSTVLGAGGINHYFLDGTDLLIFQNSCPWDAQFRQASANQLLGHYYYYYQYYYLFFIIILFIIYFFHYIYLSFFCSVFFYHYNYFIRYLVEIVQEWSYNPKIWTGFNYPFTSVIKVFLSEVAHEYTKRDKKKMGFLKSIPWTSIISFFCVFFFHFLKINHWFQSHYLNTQDTCIKDRWSWKV